MNDFRKFLEAGDGANLFDKRAPLTARMRRHINLTGPKADGTIGDLGKTAEWSPTHKSKNPNLQGLEIQVTSNDGKVVRYILSYGGTGGEPAATFDKNWTPIANPELN